MHVLFFFINLAFINRRVRAAEISFFEGLTIGTRVKGEEKKLLFIVETIDCKAAPTQEARGHEKHVIP